MVPASSSTLTASTEHSAGKARSFLPVKENILKSERSLGNSGLRTGLQVVKVISSYLSHYATKSEVCGFETRWGKCIFSIYLILLAALGPGVDSDSDRN
jgi:hypothetical protein